MCVIVYKQMSFCEGAFAHGVMGHRIDPSWSGPIELFLTPASGVTKAVVCAILSVGWCI